MSVSAYSAKGWRTPENPKTRDNNIATRHFSRFIDIHSSQLIVISLIIKAWWRIYDHDLRQHINEFVALIINFIRTILTLTRTFTDECENPTPRGPDRPTQGDRRMACPERGGREPRKQLMRHSTRRPHAAPTDNGAEFSDEDAVAELIGKEPASGSTVLGGSPCPSWHVSSERPARARPHDARPRLQSDTRPRCPAVPH